MYLVSLKEQGSQKCNIPVQWFGKGAVAEREASDDSIKAAFKVMKQLAEEYGKGKIEIESLYERRDEIIKKLGIKPQRLQITRPTKDKSPQPMKKRISMKRMKPKRQMQPMNATNTERKVEVEQEEAQPETVTKG